MDQIIEAKRAFTIGYGVKGQPAQFFSLQPGLNLVPEEILLAAMARRDHGTPTTVERHFEAKTLRLVRPEHADERALEIASEQADKDARSENLETALAPTIEPPPAIAARESRLPPPPPKKAGKPQHGVATWEKSEA